MSNAPVIGTPLPHITVDCSAGLTDVFDSWSFLRELHPLVIEMSHSQGVCKTFFRVCAETVVAGLAVADAGLVHVEIGLLPGREDGVKARLSEAVLALLEKHLHTGHLGRPVRSVEVRDLGASYRLTGQVPAP
ncbi:5-carboxymethyl-2-hydroxymuconate delta isomerase [Streptomyces canus]|uniref:5-carboxymethyl-2-hydroxymuconate Delta-isomerase n=1 Tax=Streptomyces canus TaxID=58343 RepID=UPI002E34F7E9|nr:5-carboxymethyl-2-hydroxymuconate delta isomerase [Streptomyces canus]